MESQKDHFTAREIKSAPSTLRTSFLKKRYLESSLMVDIEYIRHLTHSHKQTDGLDVLERRAIDHAYALSHLTPVIFEHDLIAGNKTRFIRGAIPYVNYAADPFLKELRKEGQDAQSKYARQGRGGGIEKARQAAEQNDLLLISDKFLISKQEYEEFKDICEYWEDKCFMAQGDRLWKQNFKQKEFIENGWEIGLYTAPHEPCPEGRLILDFETALTKGYNAIIHETEEKIGSFQPGNLTDGAKLIFWRAAITVLKGAAAFALNYAREAERLANEEKNPVRKSELEQMARACQHVPMEPPRNFREAVQSFWLTYLVVHLEGSHLGY
jgi:hypothetical protein